MKEISVCLETARTWLRLAEEEFEKQMPKRLTDEQIDARRAIQNARKYVQTAALLLQETAVQEPTA